MLENSMTIFLGADHGGFIIKEQIKTWLTGQGYQVQDVGADKLDESDSYPQYALAVATQVAQNPGSLGILTCHSGGGMVIAANKVKGIRAVAVEDEKSVIHAREHNNANVISLSGDWIDQNLIEPIITKFLTTPFDLTSRHQNRLNQITNYENESK